MELSISTEQAPFNYVFLRVTFFLDTKSLIFQTPVGWTPFDDTASVQGFTTWDDYFMRGTNSDLPFPVRFSIQLSNPVIEGNYIFSIDNVQGCQNVRLKNLKKK